MHEKQKRILDLVKARKKIKSRDIVSLLKVSRQYVNLLLNSLMTDEKLIKVGSTKNAFYVLPQYAAEHIEVFPTRVFKKLKNSNLEEHKILEQVENSCPLILNLGENIRSIFAYAFTEMLNNAIEHSNSENIEVEVTLAKGKLGFVIADYGVGVFKNIMRKKNLGSVIEAIQEISKGKLTTKPQAHSGEGIFFTSKTADTYILDSYGTQMIVKNAAKRDLFMAKPEILRRGTRVTFTIATSSERHLKDVFDEFTEVVPNGDFGFDKTEIKVKLFTEGTIHVSRSQARRILTGLEKFTSIIFDFEKVPLIGQAFADEIFRVFYNKYPDIKLNTTNTNDAVKFMITRAQGKNPRKPTLFDSIE